MVRLQMYNNIMNIRNKKVVVLVNLSCSYTNHYCASRRSSAYAKITGVMQKTSVFPTKQPVPVEGTSVEVGLCSYFNTCNRKQLPSFMLKVKLTYVYFL